MGNKQKNIKLQEQREDSVNSNCYLLCPQCWQRIPYINTFITGNNIKLKLLCTCIDKNFQIFDVSEYINLITNRKNSIHCLNHQDIKGQKFCMNCENWLCQTCFTNHSKDICKSEYNKNNDLEKTVCFEHETKKIYFCKICKELLCKQCFLNHNVKNKKVHKGININYYLTNEKINSKLKKFNKYEEEIITNIDNIKNGLIKNLDSLESNKELNNDVVLKYKNLIKDKYKSFQNINEQLKSLIKIILKNAEFFEAEILNTKFICNVVMNTSIKVKNIVIKKELNIIEQLNYLINFIDSNYINKKFSCKLNKIDIIEKSNISTEMMLALPENKFVCVNKDCAIEIWDILEKKKIYTFHEHSNNITSIILLKNKKYFASASDDSTIKIWDYSKGICINTIITEGKPFLLFEILNKENQIGCIPYRNSVSIYEYDSSKKDIIFNISLEKSLPWIESLYQFPDDGKIILSTSGTFEVYTSEMNKIKKVYIYEDTPQIFLKLKNDDLAVGFISKDIFIYNKEFMYKSRLCGHKKNITTIVEYDENKILTGSLDSNIILWRINDYEMVSSFINNNYGIKAMILINKNIIITSSYYKDNIINSWEIEFYEE